MNRRVFIIVFCIVTPLMVFGFWFFDGQLGSQKLSIKTTNVSEIEIYSKTNLDKPEKTLDGKDFSARLKKGDYTIKYTGSEGYADGTTSISLSNDALKIEINPWFSETKLASMLKTEKQSIDTAILSQIKGVQLYVVQTGALYEYGDWYGTVLKYNGEDFYNADSLRLVMKKENGKWLLKTNPPEIILTKATFPEIPGQVLEAVNTQLAEIPSRYTSSD